MTHRQRARRHDQAAIRGAREGRDGALDLGRVAHVDRAHLHPERRRHGLDDGELADPGGYGGIPKDRRARHARRDLLEQLQPFPAQAVFELHEAGGVAARPRQALDEAGADRIGDIREHDRHGAGRLQQRRQGRVPAARMTSGASATNSAAYLRMASASPAPQRCRSARCGRRSSPIAAAPAGTPRCGPARPGRPRCRRPMSTPMRRIALALLRARRERPRAAAPPSSVMNSRRFIRSPRRRAASTSRHVEAERLGGLEIDHQLVLGRRLHRQVGRLLALEDAVDIAGRAAVLVDRIGPVGDQAAAGDEVAVRQ